MIDISHEPQEELVLGEYRYRLFLSFDNVLRVFDVWQDEDIEPRDRVFHALYVLTRERDFYGLTIEQALAVYDMIHAEHIKVIRPTDAAPRYDLEGNVLPTKNDPEEDEDGDDSPPFSFKYDGDYIFASFMQAYGIDLIEQQGKLSWRKFNALLSGLPSDTKLAQVMEIRAWKPSDTKDKKERERMRKLQKIYALPDERRKTQQDAEEEQE